MTLRLSLLLLVLLAAAPLCARERQPGDFAPRTSLVYVRFENLGGALAKVAGDDFETPIRQALWAMSRQDFDRGGAGMAVTEALRFLRHARRTEIALADVMLRAPHVQVVLVADLAEGAPAEFSKELLDALKAMGDKVKAEPKSLELGDLRLKLFPGMFALTTTPALMQHVLDVREGRAEESLSGAKRFATWAKNASGEIAIFADAKAIRSALDRLGKDALKKAHEPLQLLEWNKWDYLSITGELPRRADTQISLHAQLMLSEPWGGVASLMKPAGGFTLHRRLPRETRLLGLAQLGNDHKKTLNDVLGFFHDQQLGEAARRAQQTIDECKRRMDDIDKRLADLKEGDERAQLEAERKQLDNRAADAKKQLEDSKPRAFEPSKDARVAAGITEISQSERFIDGFYEGLKAMELEPDQVLACFGGEIAIGNLALPGAGLGGMDTNQTMFGMIQTSGDIAAVKDKVMAFLRKMEESQRQPGRMQRQWWVSRRVQGGELLIQRGGWQQQCFFFGDGVMGFANCEDVALRALAASIGVNALPHGRVPGADNAASKVLQVDLAEVLAANVDRGRGPFRSPTLKLDFRKLMANGLRLTVATNEQQASLGMAVTLAGDLGVRQILDALAEEAAFDRARRHDEKTLESLKHACEAWLQAERPKLTKMKEDELKKALKEVSPQSLANDGHLKAFDGLRSAFDPLLKDRFKAMLDKRADEIGAKPDVGGDVLAESGFAWFGVPPDIATRDIDSPRRPKDGGPKDWGKDMKQFGEDMPVEFGPDRDMWIVCAHYGSWARKNRMVLMHAGGAYRIAYLADDAFNAIRAANSRGQRLEELPRAAEGPRPDWRRRMELSQNLYGMCEIGDRLLSLRANGEMKSYAEAAFRGGDHGAEAAKMLSAVLKYGDRERFYGITDAAAVEITATENDFKVRVSNGNLWIEVGSDNSIRTSWDD